MSPALLKWTPQRTGFCQGRNALGMSSPLVVCFDQSRKPGRALLQNILIL